MELHPAWIGVVGGAVGGLLTLAGTWLTHHLQERSRQRHDEPRRRLLLTMLRDERYPWRKLETLMHVVGADEETTKRLLLSIGARGSEDGQELWGLIERHPFRTG